jgi:hypothetical protein
VIPPIAKAVVVILIFLSTRTARHACAAEQCVKFGRQEIVKPTVVLATVSVEESNAPRPLNGNDRLRPIEEIALPSRADFHRMPADLAAQRFGTEPGVLQHSGASRCWESSLYSWEAPALCHCPLYFEDENLERNGRSAGIFQPAASTAHACGRLVALPYLMGVTSPHECVYTLGKGRPGSCAPHYWYRPPLSLCGALYEAGAISGLAFIVP